MRFLNIHLIWLVLSSPYESTAVAKRLSKGRAPGFDPGRTGLSPASSVMPV